MDGPAAIRSRLRDFAKPERAEVMERFFRTGPGEYGEGDVLLGVAAPNSRKVARAHRDLPHDRVLELLASEIHEERLVGLVIWTERWRRDPDWSRSSSAAPPRCRGRCCATRSSGSKRMNGSGCWRSDALRDDGQPGARESTRSAMIVKSARSAVSS